MSAVPVGSVQESPMRGRLLRVAAGAFTSLRVVLLVAMGLALAAAIAGGVLLATQPQCSGLSPVYDACVRENRPAELAGVGLLAGGLILAGALLGLLVGVAAPRWHGRRWARRHMRQLDDARCWHADGRLPREAFAGYEAAFKAFRDGRTGGQAALSLGLGILVLGLLLGLAAAVMLVVAGDGRGDPALAAMRTLGWSLLAPAAAALAAGIPVAVAAARARRLQVEALDARLLDLATEASRSSAVPPGRRSGGVRKARSA